MGQLLIRNLDESIIAAWKRRADANGRSLQAELHAELTRAVSDQARANAIRALDAIRAGADMGKLERSSLDLLREDRDNR
ncbi:hypothetical protein [Novosphingobium colocasiae]|uniref:FitA-like ribbon-helix-helix domain-containing protein n=1 Tax=Novosphingobium colocasiae TaxID=1256513 RepID=UPI0035B4F3DC